MIYLYVLIGWLFSVVFLYYVCKKLTMTDGRKWNKGDRKRLLFFCVPVVPAALVLFLGLLIQFTMEVFFPLADYIDDLFADDDRNASW